MQANVPNPAATASPASTGIRLYSARSIGVASALGSLLAGTFMLSRNYARLQSKRAAGGAIAGGVLATAAVGVVSMQFPRLEQTGVVVALPLAVAQALVAYFLAVRLQGEDLARHRASGGAYHSSGRVILVSLLSLPAVVTVLFAVALITQVLMRTAG